MADKFELGFLKTKKSFAEKIKEVFTGTIDDETYDAVLEILISGDIPLETADKIIESAQKKLSKAQKSEINEVKTAVRESMLEIMQTCGNFKLNFPAIIILLGVNGAGKTTTVAKIANMLKSEGKTVLIAAADPFRAAACEQLDMWAEKLGVGIVKSVSGQDPSSVVFDAISKARAKQIDVVLCDTAGRFQNKTNLVEELKKIARVADNNKGEYNLYTAIVLDAMSGGNSLVQVKEFGEAVKTDCVIMTKTDSSAKGGVLLGLADQSNAKIWLVGTGEGEDDIVEFDSKSYVNALI